MDARKDAPVPPKSNDRPVAAVLNATAPATADDIAFLYRVFFDRSPESERAVAEKLGAPIAWLARDMARSPEFFQRLDLVTRENLDDFVRIFFPDRPVEDLSSDEVVRILDFHHLGTLSLVQQLLLMAASSSDQKRRLAALWPQVGSGSYGRYERIGSEVLLIVPTVNSAAWIEPFLHFYRSVGLSPIYAVDARTSDGVRELIEANGFETFECSAEARRVEALLPAIAARAGGGWLLRIDDDELPTPELLAFADLPQPESAVFSFPRAQLRHNPTTGRLERSHFMAFGPKADMDRQWRLFHSGLVEYDVTLHTPGLAVKDGHTGPADGYLLHFDWAIRSYEQRIRKYMSYEEQDPRRAADRRHFSLYEEINPQWHLFQPIENDLFQSFGRALAEHKARAKTCDNSVEIPTEI